MVPTAAFNSDCSCVAKRSAACTLYSVDAGLTRVSLAQLHAVAIVAIVALVATQTSDCTDRESCWSAQTAATAALVALAEAVVHARKVTSGAFGKAAASQAGVATAGFHARALVAIVALGVREALHCQTVSEGSDLTDSPQLPCAEQNPAWVPSTQLDPATAVKPYQWSCCTHRQPGTFRIDTCRRCRSPRRYKGCCRHSWSSRCTPLRHSRSGTSLTAPSRHCIPPQTWSALQTPVVSPDSAHWEPRGGLLPCTQVSELSHASAPLQSLPSSHCSSFTHATVSA